MIPGVDRSHLNSPVSLASLAAKGIKFVFFKATQGDTFIDLAFAASWKEASETEGLHQGTFHFFNPQIDGIVQAKHYTSVVGDFSGRGCLPPFVDVEDLVGSNEADTVRLNKWVEDNWQVAIKRLQDFLNCVKTDTGRTCGIYSYNGYMRDTLHGVKFPDNPFWLSSIQATCPNRYDTGKLPEFWQYTYNWQNTDMDGNYFTGTQQQLDLMANIQ